jgi:hypothetical protein
MRLSRGRSVANVLAASLVFQLVGGSAKASRSNDVRQTNGGNAMRRVTAVVLVFIAAGLPAFGANPAPKVSVEIRAGKDTEFTAVATVLAAVRKIDGMQPNLSLRVQEGSSIAARIRVPAEVSYSELYGLADALRRAGVRTITVAAGEKKEPTEEKTSVAWGKVKDGLQAGLALRPADKHSCQVGDTLRFLLMVRNVGDRPVEMPYLAVERDARVGPSVLDAGGKRPPMSGPAYSSVGGRAISKLALAAGQEVEFGFPQLIFGPAGEPRVQEKATVQAGPGTYRVSYNVFYLNADDTGNYLSTGEVKVEVIQSEKRP